MTAEENQGEESREENSRYASTRAIVLELPCTRSGYCLRTYALGKNSSGSRLRARKQTEIDDPHLAETLARENLRVMPSRGIIIYPAHCFSSIYRRADLRVQRTAFWLPERSCERSIGRTILYFFVCLRSVFRIEPFCLVVFRSTDASRANRKKPAINSTCNVSSNNKSKKENLRRTGNARNSPRERSAFFQRVCPDFPMNVTPACTASIVPIARKREGKKMNLKPGRRYEFDIYNLTAIDRRKQRDFTTDNKTRDSFSLSLSFS